MVDIPTFGEIVSKGGAFIDTRGRASLHVPRNQMGEDRERLVGITRCALMAAVLSLLSLVAIPLPISPVPFTLQSLGVYMAAGLLGPRWGTAAVAVYLLVGVAGLPVFAGGEAGVGVLLGPKGGYLMAFLPAAFLVGLASRQLRDSRGSPKSVGLLVAGLMGAAVVIYALGAGWLAMVTGLGATQVIVVGVVPFVPGDAVKLVAAAILIPAVARARRAARS